MSKQITNQKDSVSSKNILNQNKVIVVNFPVVEKQEVINIVNEKQKINLIIGWYNEHQPDRRMEYLKCLKKNIESELIDNIFILGENIESDFIGILSEKIKFIKVDHRMTYNQYISFINSITSDIDINILANTDIYFDETLDTLRNKIQKNDFIALSRWDVLLDGTFSFHNSKASQDSWIFQGKIEYFKGGEYFLGMPGCDNKIAYELRQHGYNVINPSMSVRTYHIHNTGIRNYNKVKDKIPKPYFFPVTMSYEPIVVPIKKKILHIGLNEKYQQSLCNALKNLGEYIFIDWQKFKGGLDNKILLTVGAIKPDLIFMQIQTPNIISTDLVNKILKIVPDVEIVNWTGDIRQETPQWMIELAAIPNIKTSFSNGKDIAVFDKLNLKSFHLQIGFEERLFKKAKNIPKTLDVIFTGSFYPKFELSNLRRNTIMKLKEKYGERFQIYGGGWGKEIKTNPSIIFEDTATIYNHTKIGVSVNNINAKNYSSDRLFNMMATGMLVMVHKFDGLENYFEDKKHVVYWNNIEELIELIEYYLENEDERIEIATAGYNKVWSEHKWSDNIEKMKTEILKWS